MDEIWSLCCLKSKIHNVCTMKHEKGNKNMLVSYSIPLDKVNHFRFPLCCSVENIESCAIKHRSFLVKICGTQSQIVSPNGTHSGFRWVNPLCPLRTQSGFFMGFAWVNFIRLISLKKLEKDFFNT